MADQAAVTAPARSPQSAVIDAVLDLVVDAILADVMGVSGDNGSVPWGTEPYEVEVSEHLDDAVGVQSPPEAT